MPKSLIFVDREKLSPRYIPPVLPHRKDQIDLLLSIYSDVLEHVNKAFLRVTQIVGDVGTGKTCTAVRFGETIQKEAVDRKIKLQYVYLNCIDLSLQQLVKCLRDEEIDRSIFGLGLG